MALIKEYFDLTKRYLDEYGENTILLMQVGSFFEVYGIYNQKTELISFQHFLNQTPTYIFLFTFGGNGFL